MDKKNNKYYYNKEDGGHLRAKGEATAIVLEAERDTHAIGKSAGGIR